MTDTPDMSPEEGAQAIVNLIGEIGNAQTIGDLDGMAGVIDRMDDIVAATGVELPGMSERLAAIKGQADRAKRHFENTDAALWAGDLKRAEALMNAGPGLDTAALHGEAFEQDDGDETREFEITFEFGDESDDDDYDLADFAASLGLDPADLDLIDGVEEDDPFAEVAQGAPGAIDALIASGADLNTPCGPSRHTALLAALDAPGRSADGISKLISAGADVRVVHEQGDNAVSWAMGYHHPGTVSPETEARLIACLAENGADVNHAIGDQMTVLQRAILQAGAPQVAALLTLGADPSVDMFETFQPEKLAGATLPMLAAAKPDVLRLLLDHGVDPRRPDRFGRDPLGFVRSEAEAARDRVDPDDGWTIDHAEALEISLGMLERHQSA